MDSETLLSVPRLSYTTALLTSVYLIRRVLQDPNPPSKTPPSPPIDSKSQSTSAVPKSDFLFAAGYWLTPVPYINLYTAVALYHALLSFLPESQRPAVCPNYASPTSSLNKGLFAWTPYTLITVTALILSGALRIAAYANLGRAFTFHLTTPSGLVTTGLHGYIRHPSYTALILNLIAMVSLFFRHDGVISCFGPGSGTNLDTLRYAVEICMKAWAVLVLPIWFFMRVRQEEGMLERVFGEEWVEYARKTRRFVPFVF
ncbi:hypothetical protein BJX64DRAFT_256760 [Aspergillus heterothallicus]